MTAGAIDGADAYNRPCADSSAIDFCSVKTGSGRVKNSIKAPIIAAPVITGIIFLISSFHETPFGAIMMNFFATL